MSNDTGVGERPAANYFEEATASGCICALVTKKGSDGAKAVGFASFDRERATFKVCEFRENLHFSVTESVFLQLRPTLCVALLPEAIDQKKVRDVAESCDVRLELGKSSDFGAGDLEQDLGRLLKEPVRNHVEQLAMSEALRAVAALVVRETLLSDTSLFGQCHLLTHPISAFMRLDKASFSALNVLPKPGDGIRTPTSVYGFLNRCRTQVGQRLLRQWLTQPLANKAEISTRHELVQAFVEDENFQRRLQGTFLRHVPDLDKLTSRFHRVAAETKKGSKSGYATCEDVVRLYECLLSSRVLMRELEAYRQGEGKGKEVISRGVAEPLQACLKDFEGFQAMVEQSIDLQEAQRGNYVISKVFDPEFGRLAAKRDEIHNALEESRARAEKALPDTGASKKGSEGVKLVQCSLAAGGWALRVVKRRQAEVQKQAAKYKTVQINKGEFLFTVTEIEKLGKELQQVDAGYEKAQKDLLEKALSVAATYYPVMERLSTVYGQLDVILAFAHVALTTEGCTFVRPKLVENKIVLKDCVHLLVSQSVAMADYGPQRHFIANDAFMERETSRLQLITGPNMGGKSTYMRSVALCALLNQVGCFVPCTEAELPVFEAVMCRVGASDMQLRGISTFMAEMLEAACILNTANQNTLVIMDELGRGTSTADGFGLAWAIAQTLVESIRCFCLFATHFHEVAALEREVKGVKNLHAVVEVDPKSNDLIFLYKIIEGISDRSYGIHVAELAEFPKQVVEEARRMAAEFEAGAGAGFNLTPPTKRRRLLEQVFEESKDEDDFVKRVMQQFEQ